MKVVMTSTSAPHTDTAHLSDTEYGISIIRHGIEALTKVTSLIDGNFTQAIDILSNLAPGARVVVSGMGKAGFVGMKISATLSSIGVPSFFLHPADAVHGDLGRFGKSDVALLLSNSGETEEIIRLIPTLKEFGSAIISITSSPSSTLGQLSTVVITTGPITEACPLNLAPTTSTTVMMALGDALAMTLVRRRGFTREEFAKFHPGGSLGRALMRVSEIMRVGDELCVVEESVETRSAIQAMIATPGRPGAMAIVDSAGILVGIFTDGNLRRQLGDGVQFLEVPIGAICSRNPLTIRPSQLAQEAARLIRERQVDQLIVIDDANTPVGLLDIQDLLAYGMIERGG